jgi:23S rRNA (cytidine1920-2'-O)/16S rRNA (cytidine1409-2'-O)-methyltransferase
VAGSKRTARRLDLELVARGLAPSRERAQALILAGAVTVDGERVTRAAAPVSASAVIATRAEPDYASRGGEKLAHALDAFRIDPKDRVCVDVGASTGGFTDVLLRRGARRVYAIDVGRGQLAWRLRLDQRVTVMEGLNVRELSALPEMCALAVADVSFISLRLALPPLLPFLEPDADVVALVKPQFEVGPQLVSRGGIVRQADARASAVVQVVEALAGHGLGVQGIERSPLKGREGNVEIFVHFRKGSANGTIDLALHAERAAS